MKQLVQLMALFMITTLSKAQQNSDDKTAIIGKWEMIKMDIKDGPYFDLSDIDLSYKRFIKTIIASREAYSNEHNNKKLSKEDSAWAKLEFEKAIKEFQTLFIEFHADNKYITNTSKTEDISILTTGSFSLNPKKHILSTSEKGQKVREVSYELKTQQLILHSKEMGSTASTIIYKKIE